MSTSRVYSIKGLSEIPVSARGQHFVPVQPERWPAGFSALGVQEEFSTAPPVSLYGATKLASELLALEYGATFGFPVWINRCGVLAGAGQFGRADQGIFAFWLNAWLRDQPLRYLGFGGLGYQVRDCLHPRDLAGILLRQLQTEPGLERPPISNVSGGVNSARSLAEISAWCADRWGSRSVASKPKSRQFDLPWVVLDASLAEKTWNWCPTTSAESILNEIAVHAETHPEWLELSTP